MGTLDISTEDVVTRLRHVHDLLGRIAHDACAIGTEEAYQIFSTVARGSDEVIELLHHFESEQRRQQMEKIKRGDALGRGPATPTQQPPVTGSSPVVSTT